MRFFYLAGLIFTFAPSIANAHALGFDWKLKDGKVAVEAYYDDDSPVAKAKVTLVNDKKEVVASETTDADGRCSFAAPGPGKYEIHVDAGAGHRAEKVLTIAGAPAPTPVETTSDTSRAEFTSTPWLKIGIGLGTIGGLCGAFLLASVMRKNGKPQPGHDT